MNVVQSTNPDVDTLKCPKCKAIWRAKVEMYEEIYGYEYGEDYCPNKCFNFFGFRIKGKAV